MIEHRWSQWLFTSLTRFNRKITLVKVTERSGPGTGRVRINLSLMIEHRWSQWLFTSLTRFNRKITLVKVTERSGPGTGRVRINLSLMIEHRWSQWLFTSLRRFNRKITLVYYRLGICARVISNQVSKKATSNIFSLIKF